MTAGTIKRRAIKRPVIGSGVASAGLSGFAESAFMEGEGLHLSALREIIHEVGLKNTAVTDRRCHLCNCPITAQAFVQLGI